jgi:hypothetical protein
MMTMLSGFPLVEFPEESLYLTQEQGYGYYPAYLGQKLKGGCYEIIRKLEHGHNYSTWLVSYPKCRFIPFKSHFQSA